MIAYASRTGTRRNLTVLRRAGWRLLVSATGALRPEGFRFGLDSGAWTYHQLGLPFDAVRYERAVTSLASHPDCDWVVLPDIVAGGNASLDLSLSWLPRVQHPLVLISVQDGVTVSRVERVINTHIGIFVGGSTEYKLQSMPLWGQIARAHGAYLHVGRVNTALRIRQCAQAGADSFDGTSVSRYAVTLPRLESARDFYDRQGELLWT